MATLTVLQSIAFREAFLELAGQFDRASGHVTRAVFDGGLNVSARIASGERVDAIVMSADEIDEMARGHMIADVVAIIGTQDIVFGEIDR